ncbi:MAG: plastocyanin/azurin family copper-binding protein, partial [Nitrosopumilus sp.]|nr:plastocyanin/azurin family copper-binding protein [Nitrosopumilus sp.]
PSGVFDSSLLMADATFAFTFEDAGEYDYFCMVHPWMIGSVSVTEGSMMEETMMEETMMEETMMEEPVGPQTHSVEIPVGTSVPGCEDTNACYLPANITINAGDTVEWPNVDTAAHTVTSGSPAEGPSGVFDSSLLMADATFAFTFEDAGEYDYFCMVHPWMIGSVSVN